jgi:hypothetical protein
VCPHTTLYYSIYVSLFCCMCVLILLYVCPHAIFEKQRENSNVRPPLKFKGIYIRMYASYAPMYVCMYVSIHIHMYVGEAWEVRRETALEIQRHPYMYVLCMYVYVRMHTYVCMWGGGNWEVRRETAFEIQTGEKPRVPRSWPTSNRAFWRSKGRVNKRRTMPPMSNRAFWHSKSVGSKRRWKPRFSSPRLRLSLKLNWPSTSRCVCVCVCVCVWYGALVRSTWVFAVCV